MFNKNYQSWSASPDDVANFPLPQHQRRSCDQQSIRYQQHHPCPIFPNDDSSVHSHDKQLPAMSTDNLLRVQIDSPSSSSSSPSSSSRSTFFYIPVSLMLQREIEMQEAARMHGIGRDRWCSSRLFRMWKAESTKLQKRQKYYYYIQKQRQIQQQQQQQQQQPEMGTNVRGVVGDVIDNGRNDNAIFKNQCLGPAYHKADPTTITLLMSPEDSLQTSNSSSRFFQWKPWLTKCIRAYYNTGILRIPDECRGDDILLALEYFGILTASPETFVFDSRRAYERIQCWSRYFTYRTELAENLLEDYDTVLEEEERLIETGEGIAVIGGLHMWVLFPEVQYDSIFDAGLPLQVDGLPARKLTVGATGGLHSLFFGDSKERNGTSALIETDADFTPRQMPPRFRRDFCEYLRQSMPPRTTVGFELEDVHINTNSSDVECQEVAVGVRPVIRVTYSESDSSPSFLGILEEQQPQCAVQIFHPQREDGMDVKSKSSPSSGNRSSSLTTRGHNSPINAFHTGTIQSDGNDIADHDAPKASLSHCPSLGRKNPGSEFESSTYRSPHTKTVTTLEGEGIVSASALSDPLLITETILFPESPDDGENALLSNSERIKPRIGFCEIENDPLSPSAWHENTRHSNAVEVEQFLEIEDHEKRQVEGEDSIRGDHHMAPIKYINTEYGDLRSVTSMLSEPAYYDVSVRDFHMGRISEIAKKAFDRVGERSAAMRIIGERALTQKRTHTTSATIAETHGIEVQRAKAANTGIAAETVDAPRQEIATPPRTKRNIPNTPPWHLNDKALQGGVEETKEGATNKVIEGIGDSQASTHDSKEEKNDEKQQQTEGARQVKIDRDLSSDANGYWGHLLARICETVVPAPSVRESPRSPVRYITLETNLTSSPSKECSTKSEKPHRHCACPSEPESVLVTDIASSWLSTFSAPASPDQGSREGLYNVPNSDELLDKARELGSNLSSHFDALMKIAYDNNDEQSLSPLGRRRTYLSSIPEEIPIPVIERDHTVSSNYSSSGSNSRRKKSASPGPGDFVVSNMNSSLCFALPMSKSFDSDTLEKKIPMPPHPGDSRRPRREKHRVARKKTMHLPSSPKSSSRSSHESRAEIRPKLASDKPRAKDTWDRAPVQPSMNDENRIILGTKRQQLM
jgi:hypothetical protein